MSRSKLACCKGALWGAVIVVLLVGCGKNDAISQAAKMDASRPGIAETKAIAEEGFIYGLPIVMNYAVMYEYAVDRNSGQFKAPFNQIKNEPRVFTYKDTAIVTPNSDTPYSFLWMDVRAEPMVLSVPAVEKSRYYAVQLEDGNTFNYGYIGSRATGNEAGDYMVVGPDWKGTPPPGIKKVFRSTTQFPLAGFRTQLFNPADMPNVVKVQAGYKVQPLSAYLKQPAPPAAPAVNFPKIDKEMVKTNFFQYLDLALQFAPPGPEEKDIRARLARLGIGPGKTFDFKDLSLEHKVEVGLGMKDGEAKIDRYLLTGEKIINGWKVGSYFGDRAFFNGNWLLRAAGAKAGIYGNDAIEATYPMTKTLANGEELDGSKHNYTLTFPNGQYPPVNAFWSVTMYDGKTQLLIGNPINRYLINSPMLPTLKRNADGSLTLYIQKDSPGADQGIELAAGTQRPDLHGDASVLAEDRGALDLAARQWDVAAAGHRGGEVSTATVRRTGLAFGLLALIVHAPGTAQAQGKLSEEEALKIGVEAVVYGLPLVVMELTKRVSTNVPGPQPNAHAPINQFGNALKYPPASDHTVVRLNIDTLYSWAWLDLSKEPMVLSVPDTHGRYYMMPMLDAWTEIFASPGKRTTGTKAGNFAIIGPGWKGTLPKGVKEIKATTNTVWIIGRTQTNGPKDYPAVNAVQKQYKITPFELVRQALHAAAGRGRPGRGHEGRTGRPAREDGRGHVLQDAGPADGGQSAPEQRRAGTDDARQDRRRARPGL